eukprot:9301239-Heterocapsa_arctica.AAC.1
MRLTLGSPGTVGFATRAREEPDRLGRGIAEMAARAAFAAEVDQSIGADMTGGGDDLDQAELVG